MSDTTTSGPNRAELRAVGVGIKKGPIERRYLAGIMARRRAAKNARRVAAGLDPLPVMRHPKARERARKARQA
jgi:hypothetical protein